MFVPLILFPSIVDDHRLLDRRFVEEPRQQLGAPPVIIILLPFAIRVENVRLVSGHQFVKLGVVVIGHKLLQPLLIPWMVPLVERVIESGFEPGALNSLHVVAHEIPTRTRIHAVPKKSARLAGMFVWPEGKAVVVFGRQDNIFRT